MTDISREEALAHFGVKGQKWGVRNERRANAARALVDSKKAKIERGKAARDAKKPIKVFPANKKPKPTNDEIKEARKSVATGLKKLQDAEDKYMTSGSAKDKADFDRAVKEYNDSPVHKTALRMTKGEKVATGVLLTAGAVAITSILAAKPSISKETGWLEVVGPNVGAYTRY